MAMTENYAGQKAYGLSNAATNIAYDAPPKATESAQLLSRLRTIQTRLYENSRSAQSIAERIVGFSPENGLNSKTAGGVEAVSNGFMDELNRVVTAIENAFTDLEDGHSRINRAF